MSEKSCDFFSPISFETKPPLFTFTSTYLTFVFFFGSILYLLLYVVCFLRYINIMFYTYVLFYTIYMDLQDFVDG